MLEHLRSQRDDLHVVAVAQLAGHGPEDARPARVALRVDDHGRVLVEGDVRAVGAPELLLDHLARSRISTSRQRLVALSGRDSTTRTRSPMLALLLSSWACSVVELRTIFWYRRCRRAT